MPAVELIGVTKCFGPVEVLHSLDLEIEQGEFLALVGPSGCGKSTLLRLIAGLEDPTEGTVRIGGEVMNHVDPKDRDIAMVFQSYALYPHMNVFRNMAFGLRMRKRPRDEIERKVGEAAGVLGLEELLDRFPRQLSGGQRQRVAMGRAIVRNPLVFLFDEPLSNLDAKLRVQMRIEVKALHQRLKNTAVYVTHDQVEAMTMADRIVVVNEGRVAQIGTPLAVYDRPQNLFVAQFIGSPAMNFLRGRVLGDGDRPRVRFPDGQELELEAAPRPLPEGEVVVGIRPEHFVIAESGLDCRVTLTEPLGREILIYGETGGASVCIAPGERHEVAIGQSIRLAPGPERVHLFDAENGRRL